MTANATIPVVDYLVLGDDPHLIAHECTGCGARFFDHRNACAACEATDFQDVDVPTEGLLRTFTIVHRAAPGLTVPFVAGVVDCGGTWVRANIVHTQPDPEHVTVGMHVRLVTFPVGDDPTGRTAIGFGFAPAGAAHA